MGSWIVSLTAASVLSAAAMALTPPGRVQAVTKMVCGLVCALVMISPLLQLDVEQLAVSMAAYEQQAQSILEAEEEQTKRLERTYIEQQCQAYILAKAAQLASNVTAAAVTAQWDDEALVWYPWSVTVTGSYDKALSRYLETELGILPERQEWRADE